MKKVIMYKYFNPDRLFGGYGWSIEEVWDDWNHIYSDPYYVEIPDNFNLGKTVIGEEMYFKDGCNQGYELTIGRTDCEKGHNIVGLIHFLEKYIKATMNPLLT